MDCFRFLPEKITQLENSCLKMKEQLKILEVKTKLSGFSKEKLDISLSKNSDLYKFTWKNNSMDHQIKTLYAPLISVEVERSFQFIKLF